MEAITYDCLRVECNIGLKKLHDLTIQVHPNEHAVATVEVSLEEDQADVVADSLSGQPLSISADMPADSVLLFYGVISEAKMSWEADCIKLFIQAYSLSWFLDLERKSRSFQRVDSTHKELVDSILLEYAAGAVYNIADRPIDKPYIQYCETDWDFLIRIASRLGQPVVPATLLQYPGFYFGFPSRKAIDTVVSSTYCWGLDAQYIHHPDRDKAQYIYYEVEENTPRQIGDHVLFQGESWFVCSVRAWMYRGTLRFTYRLAGESYCSVLPIYNTTFVGLTITGTVLETQAELLRIHLDIDEEQKREEAYFYTWLPDTGNIMYNMPRLETKVSLYLKNADEHSAIATNSVRQNGSACANTQNTDHRYLTTEHSKEWSWKPETMGLTTLTTGTSVMLDDNFGGIANSRAEMLIQATGRLVVRSASVNLQAPQEVTAVRRKLGTPTVLNLCHHVDTTGEFGKFQATGHYTKTSAQRDAQQTAYAAQKGEDLEMMEREKRKKLKFELAELMQQVHSSERYDLSDVYQDILSTIPQSGEKDALAGIAVGSNVLYAKMRED